MTRIQLRHDTAANFASVNPVLLDGEVAIETDTNKMKIGDGTTAYNSLEYFTGGGGSVDAYTKAETDELLDEKQNSLNPEAPINIQNSGVGTAYVVSSGQVFTGDIITEPIYLFSATPTTPLGTVDFTKSFEVIRKNVVLDSSNTSFISLISVRPGVSQDRNASIYFYNDGKIHAESTLYNNSLVTQSVDIVSGSSYDFRYYYNGTNTTQLQYKLSSADTWNTLISSQLTYNDSGFNKYIEFSGNEYVKSKLSDITFINDGNTLFSMIPNVLSLSIGAGLAIENGSLVTNRRLIEISPTSILPSYYKVFAEYDPTTGSFIGNWCEQGGFIPSGSTTGTVTFIKQFKDIDYDIITQCQLPNSAYGYQAGISNPTVSGFVWTNSGSNYATYWQACGYIN